MINFFERLKLRTVWSWNGILDAWHNEYSFRSWVGVNVISAGLAFWLLEGAELALILALGIALLGMELINTATERVVDLVTNEHHDLAGRAKDAGSASVAIVAVAGGMAWLAVLMT